MSAQKAWQPPISEKQHRLRVMCREKKFVLAQGPRLAGKSVAALHCVVEHAWLCARCNFAFLTISQTVGYDSGIWNDFTKVVIPQWIDGEFGMEWIREPFIQGMTKKPTCSVRNQFGGESVIQLESLQNEDEVEDRFKPRRYSGFYVPELTTFKKEKTFSTLCESMRVLGLPTNEHLFLADTNPDTPRHFVYRLWFWLLELADVTEINPRELSLRKQLGRLDFTLADNIWDPPERIEELKARYAHDPDLYARYIEGKWVDASEEALFYKVFRHNVHVIGEISHANNKDPEIMVPQPDCFELGTGSDLGVVNSAVAIIEKSFRTDSQTQLIEGKVKEVGVTVPVFKVLDELVVLDADIDLGDFVFAWVEKMRFWEELIGRPRKTRWTHWSDRNAFDRRDLSGTQYLHQLVLQASGGQIQLIGAYEAQRAGPGVSSVTQRVHFFRKLLYDDRIFFSAEKCPHAIDMCKSIKKGRSAIEVIQKGSVHKHIFDAISYYVCSESYEELDRDVRTLLSRRRVGKVAGTHVLVPI